MINYLIGDATSPKMDGSKLIVHICNDIGAWGKGFVLALSARWPEPERAYRQWYQQCGSFTFQLGNVQFVAVGDDLWVANLIGQRHIKSQNSVPPIRYDAVRKGLAQVAEFAQNKQATVHMPRIGCGLAGGHWDQIESIIQETLVSKGVEVFVYDLPNLSGAS